MDNLTRVVQTTTLLSVESFNLDSLLSPESLFTKVTVNDTLDSVWGQVESSHEPILVYKNGTYIGLFTLGHLLYKNRLPNTAKAQRALFSPPKLSSDSSVYEIVDAMLSTRVYSLPIISNGLIVGMIEAAKLLKWITGEQQNLQLISEAVEIREAPTIEKSLTVEDAFSLFRDNKISRLMVINEKGVLEGVLTRNHLSRIYLRPTARQRFKSSTSDPKTTQFDPKEVPNRGDLPITKVYRQQVLEIPDSYDKTRLVSTLLNSDYNSVTLVDSNRKPTGLISIRDVMNAISRLKPLV